MKKRMIQRVGDRDKIAWSVKEYAFTVAANPMSDRVQLVLEVWEDEEKDVCVEGQGR